MNSKQMSFRRKLISLFALAAICVVAVALVQYSSTGKIGSHAIKEVKVNSLTGLPGSDGPILAVKIDDTPYAHPQVGLRVADVIYIEQVEGGLTRLAALFSSSIPAKIGPVRSARISDLELLSQYGKVGFAFSGAQRKFLPEIATANLYDVGANRFGPKFYANDPLRNPPYAMMLSAPELKEEASARGISFASSAPMGWKFGDLAIPATKVSNVHISWPAASYDASWSESERRWLLKHDGEANLDDSGYQLGSPTFVIQIVSISDSEYKDKLGGVTPFSATVGSGKCFLLRDGGYIPCLWSRASAEEKTSFTDASGAAINFSQGQIWFALTSQEPVFTPITNGDASLKASK